MTSIERSNAQSRQEGNWRRGRNRRWPIWLTLQATAWTWFRSTSAPEMASSDMPTYSALLPGALAFAVQHGHSIKVAPTERLEWPKAYQRVTEQYSPQVRL